MGLTAQYTSKKLIAFTPAESELLGMLAEQAHTTVSDIIRDAIRAFAKHDTRLDRRELGARIKKMVTALPAGAKRDAVKQDADSLVAFLAEEDSPTLKDALKPGREIDSAKLFGD